MADAHYIARGHKIGIHAQKRTPELFQHIDRAVAQGTPFPVIKFVDELTALQAVKERSPSTITIGRRIGSMDGLEGIGGIDDGDVSAWVQDIMQPIFDYFALNPGLEQFVDYVEFLNEADPPTRRGYEMMGKVVKACVQLGRQQLPGVGWAIGSFNAGTPEYDEMQAFLESGVLADAHGHGDVILAYHEGVFANDPIDHGHGAQIPGAPSVPEGGGAMVGRVAYWAQLAGSEMIPAVATEFYYGGSYDDHEGIRERAAFGEVEFYPETDSLVMTPRTEDERTEGTLDVTDLSGDELTRAVMTMYVSGFDIIALESPRIETDQRRTIREATQGLVGLEVLEETRDRVVIRDLLDSSELSIHNAVTRMRLIALSMLEDAIAALSELDHDMARDVIQRDDDVDRLWMVVSRIFRSTLRTPKAAEELGVSREVCFDYQSSARQLERIADHATKIATISLEIGAVNESVAEALSDLQTAAVTVPETAMDALLEDDPDTAVDLATEARADLPEIDDRARDVDDVIRDLDEAELAQSLGLVVDSLSRTADYGGNIAESALQKAAPSP
jgi:phosphate uptake regulator